LWVTEDLRHFAAASKACRDAAYQSYQKRITFPYDNEGQRSHIICNCHKENWQDKCTSVLSKALVGRSMEHNFSLGSALHLSTQGGGNRHHKTSE